MGVIFILGIPSPEVAGLGITLSPKGIAYPRDLQKHSPQGSPSSSALGTRGGFFLESALQSSAKFKRRLSKENPESTIN